MILFICLFILWTSVNVFYVSLPARKIFFLFICCCKRRSLVRYRINWIVRFGTNRNLTCAWITGVDLFAQADEECGNVYQWPVKTFFSPEAGKIKWLDGKQCHFFILKTFFVLQQNLPTPPVSCSSSQISCPKRVEQGESMTTDNAAQNLHVNFYFSFIRRKTNSNSPFVISVATRLETHRGTFNVHSTRNFYCNKKK